jgi:hypothetical protein
VIDDAGSHSLFRKRGQSCRECFASNLAEISALKNDLYQIQGMTMNRYIRKTLVCLGWCVIVGALEWVLLGLLAGMYIGVKQGMQTAGFDGEAFIDSVATPWINSTVMGTLTVLVSAGFSGFLWGARDKEEFAPTDIRRQ